MQRSIPLTISGIAFIFLYMSAMADGYRPASDLATAFVNEVATADIVVFPTIVRDPYISRYSTASRDLVIEFLEKNGLGRARAAESQFYLGKLQRQPQLELFEDSIRTIGQQLASSQIVADYVMALEVLVPPSREGGTEVFGIHVYILKPDGENAFSFLLNSHHESFSRAELHTRKGTAKSKEQLAVESTKVATQALDEQMSSARECAARSSDKVPTKVQSGVVDDFDSSLRRGSDRYGNLLGFSTFNGKRSSAKVSTTAEHPPLPVEAAGNSVLKLDLDVKSWAGVLHSFENDRVDQWINYDWRDAKELSFWLYGNDSGTRLVVDVLDNRNRCSTVDDAERYSYEFVDNFSGWKLLSIPFEVMVRKEIGNSAPNDRLGLSTVHGWGFAALQTGGKITYFIDDVSLRHTPLFESTPAGLSRESDVWSPINELPMYGEYEKTEWQKDANEQFFATVLPRFDADREAAAEYFARIGWNFYYEGKQSAAIKRFNQAWLLHPDNQNALWGFAAISRERDKTNSAIGFYELALENGPENPKLREEYYQVRRTVVD
jgi:hypothetical protein